MTDIATPEMTGNLEPPTKTILESSAANYNWNKNMQLLSQIVYSIS